MSFNNDKLIIIFEINKILISKINKKTKNLLIKKKDYLIYKFLYIKYNKLLF